MFLYVHCQTKYKLKDFISNRSSRKGVKTKIMKNLKSWHVRKIMQREIEDATRCARHAHHRYLREIDELSLWMELFQEDKWEECATVKKFDVDWVLHYARKGMGNAAARGGSRASHSGRSIYRRRRYRVEQHGGNGRIRSGENNAARSCECGYRCPSGMAGHSPATTIVYRVIKPARGRQQSCRKRRCARFFHVVDALRTETAFSDALLISAHSATVARHRLSDSGKMRIFYLRSSDDSSDSRNHALSFLPVTGICSINLC